MDNTIHLPAYVRRFLVGLCELALPDICTSASRYSIKLCYRVDMHIVYSQYAWLYAPVNVTLIAVEVYVAWVIARWTRSLSLANLVSSHRSSIWLCKYYYLALCFAWVSVSRQPLLPSFFALLAHGHIPCGGSAFSSHHPSRRRLIVCSQFCLCFIRNMYSHFYKIKI